VTDQFSDRPERPGVCHLRPHSLFLCSLLLELNHTDGHVCAELAGWGMSSLCVMVINP
jgi:hypothetical protein